jgi:hypothetical protein
LGEVIIEPLTEASKSPKEEISLHASFTLMRYQEMQVEGQKNRK